MWRQPDPDGHSNGKRNGKSVRNAGHSYANCYDNGISNGNADIDSYGHNAAYTYSVLYQYLSHFYNVSRQTDKIDDQALLHAFERDCFYIGALGSRKTHAKRGERLKAQGARDSDIARIHAPIGLNIGAVSPSEIAVAIMAEITAQLRLPAKEKEAAA